jgi:hypothetical protein
MSETDHDGDEHLPPAEMAAIRDPERSGRLRWKGVLPFETEGSE